MAVVLTGARGSLKISGSTIAFVAGVSVDHENRLEEIAQLDDLLVAEYAENGHRCKITVSFIKLASDSGKSNNASDLFIDPVGDIKTILLQPEMIIEIVDSVPGKVETPIYTATGAKFAGGSGSMNARGVWEGSWTFNCRQGQGI